MLDEELADVEYIDGVMCRYLCMAEPGAKKGTVPVDAEKDENGFYKVKQGMTSDSGAGDTVGPEEGSRTTPLRSRQGRSAGFITWQPEGPRSRTLARSVF